MIILVGARYAYSRESVHNVNLYERYQQINRESFDAKLPYVSVSWTDLSSQNTDGITSFDGNGRPVSIELDRRRITSEQDLRAVLRHEACHVSVGEKMGRSSFATDPQAGGRDSERDVAAVCDSIRCEVNEC